MSRRIVLRLEARSDLRGIADDFEAARGLALADRFLDAAAETFSDLAAMPQLGRAYPGRGRGTGHEGLRRWRINRFDVYAVFYRPTPDTVEILRVLHGKRDIEGIL